MMLRMAEHGDVEALAREADQLCAVLDAAIRLPRKRRSSGAWNAVNPRGLRFPKVRNEDGGVVVEPEPDTDADAPATREQLEAEFDDAAFIEKCERAKLTIEQARVMQAAAKFDAIKNTHKANGLSGVEAAKKTARDNPSLVARMNRRVSRRRR